MKYSFKNIPANYCYENTVLGYVAVFYNGAWLTTVQTFEEAEQAAREHYKQNNWTVEDQAEQDYFDRHPLEQ